MADESTPPDIYGQVHPVETPALLHTKLQELEAHVEAIAAKQAYSKACSKGMISDGFKLVCLRCEQFNAELAAQRLVNYWDKRVEIFGPERAYLPLTLTGGALDDDDVAAVRRGFVRWVVDVKDPAGRAVFLADPSRQEGDKANRLRTVRALWYVVHAALEDETTQKVGMLLIVDPREDKLSNFDSKLNQLTISSLRGCLPIRIGAFHMCHLPAFVSVILPVAKLLMGQKLRQRIIVHGGSIPHVLGRLERYGLTADKIPDQLGGSYRMDQEKWVSDLIEKGL